MEFDKEAADLILQANDLADTERLAAFLADRAQPGTVIALDGDLGAGKTAFSQLFAKHLKVEQQVNSPTFTIIKEYEGRLPFYHMDVYRLSLEEADELGLEEYFEGQGVTLVEWASLIGELLPSCYLQMYLEVTGMNERRIYLKAQGAPYGQWLPDLKREWGTV
ncbi:tRNA (adenosine(37)-N6)-threonylcarbamoyltransferase complex ATPase subunit type 1 TsaE [Paenibacillus sp. YPG26]|uniref:tRNA (adenosine(37)-N6)-threonylcarbamoyltransferase complex ATPase subunit type 1 TsaE n=1 Tax=Paenibacillus sp. YPG26 TaxID=2878915 RepID=UPI00203AE3BA|nr:tRNA (adenosine(37)-N6)-threonylcarbamoyltransferase complex ATPase subunit type 1 TsaE [Paenibacillus sp. YPG26]USB34033.1 tRNA (adenosine(37)-N6)-threonylcarbamoyltransferase complex ATPase subunit type 1 TsaE [Paenibacillus sp. YPG26]